MQRAKQSFLPRDCSASSTSHQNPQEEPFEQSVASAQRDKAHARKEGAGIELHRPDIPGSAKRAHAVFAFRELAEQAVFAVYTSQVVRAVAAPEAHIAWEALVVELAADIASAQQAGEAAAEEFAEHIAPAEPAVQTAPALPVETAACPALAALKSPEVAAHIAAGAPAQ